MSEPQSPPPTAGQAPAKKKISPWVWVLGGCLVLILIVLLLMGGCAWFVTDKVQDMAADFEANPAKAGAELMVKLNPDLEMVSTDDDAGTITVRQKSTGEEFTFDYAEMAEGNISFETEEGRSTISFDPQGEGGVTVEGPDGETTSWGGDAGDDLPAWITVYPDSSEPEGAYSSTSGDQRSGAVSFRSTDPVARVLEYYERTLKAAGLEVSKTRFTAQGSDGGMLNGDSQEPRRTVTVMVTTEDGETVINVSYSEPAD